MVPNRRLKGIIYDPALPLCLVNKRMYDVYCLIPAVTIITILAFLNKRVSIQPKTCGGRPGLVFPCCFVRDSSRNRLSVAVAFAIVGQSCYKLFIDVIGYSFLSFSSESVVEFGHGAWERELTLVVRVLLFGVINFPILACLMTDHLLVGAVFGLLYTLMKFSVALILVFSCPKTFEQNVTKELRKKGYAYEQSLLFVRLPGLLCPLYLLVYFSLMLIKIVRRRLQGIPVEDSTHAVAKIHDFIHVDLLLGNKLNERSNTRCKWYIRLRDKIYKPRPDFKFSLGICSTLFVAVIFIYQMTVSWTILISIMSEIVMILRLLPKPAKFHSLKEYLINAFVNVYDEIEVTLYFSVYFTCALSVLLMLHFMKCHRDHVMASYKTKQHFDNSPSRLMIRSLSYPGYQIAYIGWGYNFVLANLFAIILFLGVFVKLFGWTSVWALMQTISPFFVVCMSIWIFQYLMGRLVFMDRRFPDKSIHINNHRLYCVMSFFFFFFNILVGYVSWMIRMVETMLLVCLFLPRIDRSPMITDFHKWDQGYMSYIGFLNVLKSYSHPVMLVFCQLLLDQQRSRRPQCSANEEEEDGRGSNRVSKTAVNRWLVAYTLMKNPKLQSSRKRFLRVSFLTDLEANGDASSTSFLV